MHNTESSVYDLAYRYLKEGYRLHQEGDYDRAQDFFARSIRYHPTAEAYAFMGCSMAMQKRYRDAIEQCAVAISLNPLYGNSYNDIGSYYIELGQYDEAEPFLIMATQIGSYDNKHYSFFGLGRIAEYKGLFTKALDYYEKALSYKPDYPPALARTKRMRAMQN